MWARIKLRKKSRMFIYTWIDSRKKRQKKRQKKNFFGIEEYRDLFIELQAI